VQANRHRLLRCWGINLFTWFGRELDRALEDSMWPEPGGPVQAPNGELMLPPNKKGEHQLVSLFWWPRETRVVGNWHPTE
jgi:hypothetical protein